MNIYFNLEIDKNEKLKAYITNKTRPTLPIKQKGTF